MARPLHCAVTVNTSIKTISIALCLVALGATTATTASADAPRAEGFGRRWAVGGYATGWAGSYAGVGLGGRLRFRPYDKLGIEVFGESLIVESPGGLRHDHPVGFNLYVPFQISERVRLRPLFGFCAVISFIEPDEQNAPRADDVLFGLHLGGGIEYLLGRNISAFLDVQAIGYLGHARYAQGWTGSVDNDLTTLGVVQASLGLQAHLGQ